MSKQQIQESQQTSPDRQAGWKVKAWCEQSALGQSLVYQLWREGRGPLRAKIKGALVIVEAPGEFLKRHVVEQQRAA